MRILLILLPAVALSLTTGCGSSQAGQESTLRAPDTGAQARNARPQEAHGDARGGGANECAVEPVYFAYDSSDLDARARDGLGRSARCLSGRQSTEVVVTGMTDPRGTEEYNMALGERRAHAVRGYIQSLGVTGDVRAVSMGEEMASGSDEGGWSRDRRADLQAR